MHNVFRIAYEIVLLLWGICGIILYGFGEKLALIAAGLLFAEVFLEGLDRLVVNGVEWKPQHFVRAWIIFPVSILQLLRDFLWLGHCLTALVLVFLGPALGSELVSDIFFVVWLLLVVPVPCLAFVLPRKRFLSCGPPWSSSTLLRFLTWNIQVGKNQAGQPNLLHQIEQIRETSANLVALQEVRQKDVPVLQESLTALSETVFFRPGQRGYGNLILSRFTILDTRSLVFRTTASDDHRPRGAVAVKVDISSLLGSSSSSISSSSSSFSSSLPSPSHPLSSNPPSSSSSSPSSLSSSSPSPSPSHPSFSNPSYTPPSAADPLSASPSPASDYLWFVTTHFGCSAWLAQQTGQALEFIEFIEGIVSQCHADPGCHGIMMAGDFNSPAFSIPARILSRRFGDQFDRVRRIDQGFGFTSGTGPISWHILRIDYFFGLHLSSLDSFGRKSINVISSGESDHFALVLQYSVL